VHDDQIAAGMCGIGSTMALDRLVEELEGITLDKNETLSDWRMRPLSSFVVV
jgi:ribonuclease D